MQTMTAIRQVKANINFKGTTDTTETENQNPKGGSNTAVALGTGVVASATTAAIAANTSIGKRAPKADEVLADFDKYTGRLTEEAKKEAKPIRDEYAKVDKEADKMTSRKFHKKTEIKVKNIDKETTKQGKAITKAKKVLEGWTKILGKDQEHLDKRLKRTAEVGSVKKWWRNRCILWLPFGGDKRAKVHVNYSEGRVNKWASKLGFAEGYLNVLKNSKDGKITRDAYKGSVLTSLKNSILGKMAKFTEKYGSQMEKVVDKKRVGILAAGIGAGAFGLAKVLIKPKQPVIAQEKIEEPDVEAAESTEAPEEKAA